jgi:AraC family transcriptional regulator
VHTMPRVLHALPLHKIRRSERLGPLVLSEVVYPPGFRIGRHSHELAALALTVRGTSTETFTNTEFDHTESGLLLRPAREPHWDSVGNRGATCFLIELGNPWLANLPRLSSLLQSPSFHRSGAITYLAQKAYREWLLNDTASPIAIQALVLEIAAYLIRGEELGGGPQPPVWLKHVKQRLDDDFAEAPSLAALAETGGVHPTHLARQFRRHYRSTIGEYLRRRRVDAAIALLARKDLSLTEIALETGFSSHGHFCTVFRRITGMTPGEIRVIKG